MRGGEEEERSLPYETKSSVQNGGISRESGEVQRGGGEGVPRCRIEESAVGRRKGRCRERTRGGIE